MDKYIDHEVSLRKRSRRNKSGHDNSLQEDGDEISLDRESAERSGMQNDNRSDKADSAARDQD